MVLASRQRLRGDWFELRFHGRQGPSARLGVVVPKRFARHAVLRNLLKRLVREAFRSMRLQLPAMDLVFRLARVVDPAAAPALRPAWRREIDGLLGRLPK